MRLTVVCDSWRPHPLAWIHRAEARSVVEELRKEGHEVALAPFLANSISSLPAGPLLLRVSDPVMLSAARMLTRASICYIGPGAAVMERCYDKLEAHRIATLSGVDCPATSPASEAGAMAFPLILKPRHGSDSIGVRLLRNAPIPPRARTADNIAQEYVRGTELTIGIIHGRAGMPLRIFLPAGTPYSFPRKYLLRPRRAPLADAAIAERVRQSALGIARIFGVNWAARIDLFHETGSGRLRFLECDVAPLVGVNSAFAASLVAAGVSRSEQLHLLLSET